jgi:hypothetical protein
VVFGLGNQTTCPPRTRTRLEPTVAFPHAINGGLGEHPERRYSATSALGSQIWDAQ